MGRWGGLRERDRAGRGKHYGTSSKSLGPSVSNDGMKPGVCFHRLLATMVETAETVQGLTWMQRRSKHACFLMPALNANDRIQVHVCWVAG